MVKIHPPETCEDAPKIIFKAQLFRQLLVRDLWFHHMVSNFKSLKYNKVQKNHKHFFWFQNSLPEFTELIYYHSKGYQRMKL